jgi:hypothetical protein
LTIYAIVMLVCWIMPHLTAGDVNESFADFARAWPISAIMIGALMYTAFLMLVCGAFVLMIGAQIGTSAPSERWPIPRHDLNPFRFSHAVTFWHFGGWLALAAGVGYMLGSIGTNAMWLILGVMTLGIGAVLLLAVNLAVRMYRQKFTSQTELANARE